MNKSPILSIITVCFNSEKTIEKTIKSVRSIKKFDPNIEYIIIDGLSKDATLKIIENNNEIIDIYISEADKGIYDGMNKGATLATGKYILYINSDDYINPDSLLKVIDTLENDDFDFLGCDVDIANISGEIVGKRTANLKPLNSMHTGMPCSHQGFIIKRKLFNEFRGFDLSNLIAADYELVLKSLLSSSHYQNFEQSIATYTLGGVSYGNVAKFENYRLQKLYIGSFCAIKNLLKEYTSSFFQQLLPNKLVLIIKKLKGSQYGYIQEKE